METNNAIQDAPIDARCSSSEGVCIPDYYTINDSICDDAEFAAFDREADIERDVERSFVIAWNLIAEAGKDPTQAATRQGAGCAHRFRHGIPVGR